VPFEGLNHLCNRRALLSDRHVNTDYVLPSLIDDGVKRNGGLTGLAVTNDQLALSAADGHHRIDGLDTRLERLFHGHAIHNARREAFNRIETRGRDRAFVIDGSTESVDHTADHGFADRNRHNAAGPLHLVALFDAAEIAE